MLCAHVSVNALQLLTSSTILSSSSPPRGVAAVETAVGCRTSHICTDKPTSRDELPRDVVFYPLRAGHLIFNVRRGHGRVGSFISSQSVHSRLQPSALRTKIRHKQKKETSGNRLIERQITASYCHPLAALTSTSAPVLTMGFALPFPYRTTPHKINAQLPVSGSSSTAHIGLCPRQSPERDPFKHLRNQSERVDDISPVLPECGILPFRILGPTTGYVNLLLRIPNLPHPSIYSSNHACLSRMLHRNQSSHHRLFPSHVFKTNNKKLTISIKKVCKRVAS